MRKLLLVLLLLAMVPTVQAVTIALVNSSQYVGTGDAVPWGEVGNAFTTGDTAREVTMLGFIDVDNSHDGTMTDDGLESDVTVTLWADATKTAIASVVVPQGQSGLLMDHFRYIALGDPVTLAAQTVYALSFNSGAVLDHFMATSYVESVINPYWVGTNDSSTWSLAYWAPAGVYPESDPAILGWDATTMTYGCVNLIPEPVTLALLGLGAIGAVVRRKK